MKKYYVLPCNVHETDAGMPEYCMFHDAAEVDAVLKRQAAAAISGMHAAKAISSGQVEQARKLRAESNPEALESERQANAILTERVAELERDAARYRWLRSADPTKCDPALIPSLDGTALDNGIDAALALMGT